MANNALSNLTPKQKLIAVVLVLILAVVIWQAVGIFGGNSPTEPAKPSRPANAQVTSAGPKGTPPPLGKPAATASMQPVSTHLVPEATLKDVTQEQQSEMKAYLGRVNKLQTLTIDRQIAEMSQAIATANLAAATAEKNMSQLLTAPAMTSSSDYGSRLASVGGGMPFPGAKGGGGLEGQPGPVTKPLSDYVLVSVTLQLEKWTAVLGYQNKLYSVSIGDILPEDGSMVASIDKQSVTLVKDKKFRKISMINSI